MRERPVIRHSGAERSEEPGIQFRGGLRICAAQKLQAPGYGYRARACGAPRNDRSAPAQRRRDVLQDRLDDMGVVVDAELVGHGEQQRVGLGDGLVLLAAARPARPARRRSCGRRSARVLSLDEADLVLALVAAAEIGAVAIVDQREDAAADRDARLARVAGRLPGLAVGADLLGLLDVERLAGLVVTSASSSAGSCRAWPPIRPWRWSRRPTRCARAGPPNAARARSRPGGFGNIGRGLGLAKPSPRSTSRNTSAWRRAMSASVSPSAGA